MLRCLLRPTFVSAVPLRSSVGISPPGSPRPTIAINPVQGLANVELWVRRGRGRPPAAHRRAQPLYRSQRRRGPRLGAALRPAASEPDRRRLPDVLRRRHLSPAADAALPRSRGPTSQAAGLVHRVQTAALDANPGVPAGDVRKALRVMRDSLDSFDDGPAERTLERLLGVFAPGAVLRERCCPI